MNDNDQVVMLPVNKAHVPPKRIWIDDDTTAVEDLPADFNSGLTSLGFIRSALRRTVWFWAAMAVAGLLIGAGVYVARPAFYQASTTLLLTVGPESVPGSAIQNDQALAQSHAVAGLVVRKLGLPGGANGFVASYTAVPITDRVLLITVNAPSGNEAVTWARTLATEFLQYRAAQLELQQKLLFKGLDQQVSETSRSRQSRASGALTVLEQGVNNTKAAAQAETASEVKNSQVLDAAALIPAHGRLKHLILYAAIGLVAGLALSLGIVVIRALISDRLRRRDDIAAALGAPVKLSVGKVRLSRWLPARHGLGAAKDKNVRRIVTHLDKLVPTWSRGVATLAIIPVDDLRAAALSVVSLAISRADHGQQVVLADLASGAPAARLLGTAKPGVHTVRAADTDLIVAVPERDDAVPAGPRARASAPSERSRFTEEVAAACGSADTLLTLAPLDPSLGAEHLPTWATDAVVMMTAGRSSWTKIHAAGEMIRLAGARLVSAVLIGADKTDESLGVTATQEAGRDAEPAPRGTRPAKDGPLTTADRSRGRHVPRDSS